MGLLLVADCAAARDRVDPILPPLLEHLRKHHAQLQVRRLDLDQGPTADRLRMAVGLGWHAREWRKRAERETDRTVVAIVEACGCGRHHLLGLGRAGVPALRWSLVEPADRRARCLDAASAKEGAPTFVPTEQRARRGGGDLRVLRADTGPEVAAVFMDALTLHTGRSQI